MGFQSSKPDVQTCLGPSTSRQHDQAEREVWLQEGSSRVWEPAVLECRLEERFCGRQYISFSPDPPSSLFYGLLLIQTWKRPGSARRPRHYLRSVLALAELQQGLNLSVPSLSFVPCDELLSILYIGYLRNFSFKKNKVGCLSKEKVSENHC